VVGLQVLDVKAREGEGGGKGLDLLAKSSNIGVALQSSDKVLHELAASLGLDAESDLDNAVQELTDLDKVSLLEGGEVKADVPRRTPPGVTAETSPQTEFLLRVMEAMSQIRSTLLPVNLLGRRSQRIKWLSDPSVTIL